MGFTWDLWDETNSSHLKMDGWKTILSFWDGLFSGAMLVSGNVHPTKRRNDNRKPNHECVDVSPIQNCDFSSLSCEFNWGGR